MALFWDDTVLWIQENTGICGHCETVDRLFCQGESLSPVELQMDGFYCYDCVIALGRSAKFAMKLRRALFFHARRRRCWYNLWWKRLAVIWSVERNQLLTSHTSLNRCILLLLAEFLCDDRCESQ